MLSSRWTTGFELIANFNSQLQTNYDHDSITMKEHGLSDVLHTCFSSHGMSGGILVPVVKGAFHMTLVRSNTVRLKTDRVTPCAPIDST